MSEDKSSTPPEPQNREFFDTAQHVQPLWGCSKCNHREAVAPINNSCPYCGHVEQNNDEQHQDPRRLPFCRRCGHKQAMTNPRHCVNPSCGVSFHPSSDSLRQLTVSEVPPGFPPGINMDAFNAFCQWHWMQQAGVNQQQPGQNYPIAQPPAPFVFGATQRGTHPQFDPTLMPLQPPITNRMAWPTRYGYQQQYAAPHAAGGHTNLSPPPIEPLQSHPCVPQARAQVQRHLMQSVQTPPHVSHQQHPSDNEGLQLTAGGDVSNQNSLLSPPPGFPASARQATHSPADINSGENTSNTKSPQSVTGSSNHAAETDPDNKLQGSHTKEETNKNNSEPEVQKDNSPLSEKTENTSLAEKKENTSLSDNKDKQPESPDENSKPKDNYSRSSKGTGVQPPADQDGSGKKSEEKEKVKDNGEEGNGTSTKKVECDSADNPTPTANKEQKNSNADQSSSVNDQPPPLETQHATPSYAAITALPAKETGRSNQSSRQVH